MTKLINWLGHQYVAPTKVPETEPWSSLAKKKALPEAPTAADTRDLQHPDPVPVGSEKNSDSIWAEFDSMVQQKVATPAEADNRDEDWIDTLSQNEFEDTVRSEFDDF